MQPETNQNHLQGPIQLKQLAVTTEAERKTNGF